MTTIQLADELGCHPSTIVRACRRMGIAKQGRDYILTPQQVATLRTSIRPGPGNPLMDTTAGARKLARKRRKKGQA